jgi:hypothetical protein
MKSLIILAGLGVSSVSAASVTPTQKVIALMSDMKAKGAMELQEEADIYKVYNKWVHTEGRDTSRDIKEAKKKIEKLDGNIEKAANGAEKQKEKAADLTTKLGELEGDLAASRKVRADEKAEFEAVQTDYQESLDAIDRAMQVIRARARDVTEESSEVSFVQLASKKGENVDDLMDKVAQKLQAAMSVKQHHELVSLLSTKQKGAEAQPQASSNAYDQQSDGVMGMLKGLNEKFGTELNTAQTQEANRERNFSLMESNLSSQIAQANKSLSKAQMKTAEQSKLAGEGRGEKKATENDLASMEKYLKDLHATFRLKTEQYKKNQEVRKEELSAIGKAIEIISGKPVSGAADEHLPSMFLQLKSSAKSAIKAKSRTETSQLVGKMAQQLLQKKDRLHLNMIAVKMISMNKMHSPLDKIVGLIQDMLVRLKEEAAEEAEHQGFCTKELADNKTTREAKTQEVDELTAKKEELEANISKAGTDITQLEKSETALAKAMGEATEIRNAEKAKNKKTIEDSKQAQDAVNAAVAVLEEFYQSAGGGEALLQTVTKHKQVPEMNAYSGQQSAKGGILGMLEVISSDFSRLEADTTASETAAQLEFDEYMTDAKKDKESHHEDAFEMKLIKDKREHEHHMTVKDLDESSKQLSAADDYYQTLKGQCEVQQVSYEERVKMRQEEIASLENALQILEDESD